MNQKNKLIALFSLIAIAILFLLNIALSSNTLSIKPAQGTSIKLPKTYELTNSINVDSNDIRHKKYKQILNASPLGRQQELLEQRLSTLDEKGISDAAAFFASLDLDKESHQHLNLLVLKYWASTSTQNVLTFVQEQFTNPFKQIAIRSIITSSCSKAESRQACITSLPMNASIDKALLSIANHAAEDNQFSDALLWVNALSDDEKRNDAVTQISNEWLAYAPEEAFQWAVINSDFIDIAKQAISIIVKTDPWQAHHLVSSINEDHGDTQKLMYKSIISSLIKEGDFLTIMSVLESTSQQQSIADVAREWIKVDPKSVLEWALNYEEFSVLSLRAMDQYTKKDHWGAYELISQIPLNRPDLRKNMLFSVFSDRADNDDYTSIMSMIEKLPNQENIEPYYESFIHKWAWQDPASAMAAVSQLPGSAQKTQYFMDTITLWGEKEPLEALKKAQSVESKELKSAALGGVIEGWAVKDINELVVWVKSEPSSASLDQSLVTASTNLFNKEVNEESLASLVNTISDETMRLEIQKIIEQRVNSDTDREFSN